MPAIDRLSADLAWVTLALAAAVFVVVEGLLLASWCRPAAGDRTTPPGANGGPPFRVNRTRELLWTALPALGLLLLGLLGARALLG